MQNYVPNDDDWRLLTELVLRARFPDETKYHRYVQYCFLTVARQASRHGRVPTLADIIVAAGAPGADFTTAAQALADRGVLAHITHAALASAQALADRGILASVAPAIDAESAGQTLIFFHPNACEALDRAHVAATGAAIELLTF